MAGRVAAVAVDGPRAEAPRPPSGPPRSAVAGPRAAAAAAAGRVAAAAAPAGPRAAAAPAGAGKEPHPEYSLQIPWQRGDTRH